VKTRLFKFVLIPTLIILTFVSTFNFVNFIANSQKINSDQSQILKANDYFPIESFVMVSQSISTFEQLCDDDGQNCLPVPLLRDRMSGTGSGVIVGVRDGKSLVLTAGHVCNGTDNMGQSDSGLTLQYSMELTSGYGNEAMGTVISLDIINDLCLVIADDYLGPSLSVADQAPLLHEKIYTMSSPLGLAAPLAVPVFEGYFAGDVSTLSIFTIPAAPGSSGSPILNGQGEIISIISAAAVSFDEYAIGCQTSALQNFLLSSGYF